MTYDTDLAVAEHSECAYEIARAQGHEVPVMVPTFTTAEAELDELIHDFDCECPLCGEYDPFTTCRCEVTNAQQ